MVTTKMHVSCKVRHIDPATYREERLLTPGPSSAKTLRKTATSWPITLFCQGCQDEVLEAWDSWYATQAVTWCDLLTLPGHGYRVRPGFQKKTKPAARKITVKEPPKLIMQMRCNFIFLSRGYVSCFHNFRKKSISEYQNVQIRNLESVLSASRNTLICFKIVFLKIKKNNSSSTI